MRHIPDINFLKGLEKTKKRLLYNLDKNYSKIQLSNLVEISEIIEKDILVCLLNELTSKSKLYFNMKLSSDKLHFLDSKGNIYQLIHSKIISNPKEYVIKLNPLSKRQLKNIAQSVPIIGYGRYSKIIFEYPQKLSNQINTNLVFYTIQEIYKAGYYWFIETVSNVVNNDLGELSKDLYSYLQKKLPSSILKQNLWFASITDGYGFRLIDESVAKSSFEIINKNSFALDYSTNRYVAELLRTYLPEEHLLMKKAIELDKCIDTSLKNAKYQKDGSIYALTLSSLYGCNSFTVYPIFKNRKVSIVALFDTNNKKYIVPFFDTNKSDIQEICKNQTEKIQEILRLMKPKKIKSYWDTVELKPGFFGFSIDLKELYRKIIKKST